MRRDDFPQPTIAILARRVAHRCSNPKCGHITTGPHTDPAKAMNVGVAAHISAASVGGPRYDAAMSSTERKDGANGIWLCQRCAKLVDNDPAYYTKDLLISWKVSAEGAARIELETGKPPASDEPSIQFDTDSWDIWKTRGNLPGDGVVLVSQWARGDVRFSCNIRLRNTQPHEEQLRDLRLQYRSQTDILREDNYAFQGEVTLPSMQWQAVLLDYGVHKSDVQSFESSDSIWFAAERVGSRHTLAWKIIDLDHSIEIQIAD